jgi:hypothetical protein
MQIRIWHQEWFYPLLQKVKEVQTRATRIIAPRELSFPGAFLKRVNIRVPSRKVERAE